MEENSKDLAEARRQGMPAAMYSRLAMSDGTIRDMTEAVHQVPP